VIFPGVAGLTPDPEHSMSVTFIGYVGNHNASETQPRSGPVIDLAFIEAMAKVQEHGGFDRVLTAFNAESPESILIGQHIAAVTERLGLMIAHRPGFTAPTLAARQLATLDHISRGRAAVHIITGAEDAELARDGDHLTKPERYARTGEYLDIVRAEWNSTTPFDYDGKYYKVRKAISAVRPYRSEGIPVYFGGTSADALEVAGRHVDIYALWGETHEQVRDLIGRVRQSAARHGRTPGFSLSLRPILADTEEAAWARADSLLARARALREKAGLIRRDAPASEGSRRLLDAASRGSRLDKRLWTGMAQLTGAQGNSTSLVGTPDQVADAMLDYVDLGIDTFLIRGFDPIRDAAAYGAELLPRVKALVAERAAQARAA
jgi:alkanesulfonate monooxygenase